MNKRILSPLINHIKCFIMTLPFIHELYLDEIYLLCYSPTFEEAWLS